jgi:hypothetical protein
MFFLFILTSRDFIQIRSVELYWSNYELILNPSWPGRPPLWFHHLAGLPVECLENIASKLTKPDWLENNSVSTLMKVYGFGYFIAWKNYSKV